MSESTKFNSLFTGSIFLVSKLYTNRKDVFKSQATVNSLLFCFFSWGGGGGKRGLTITAKLLKENNVFNAKYSLIIKIL